MSTLRSFDAPIESGKSVIILNISLVLLYINECIVFAQ